MIHRRVGDEESSRPAGNAEGLHYAWITYLEELA
jgi:hypothetical protein